jgi:DNA-binding beta-propeller fold protein YncE
MSGVLVMDATTGDIDQVIGIPQAAGGNTAFPSTPLRIAFSPDGEHAYVVDQLRYVSEISFADTAINV